MEDQGEPLARWSEREEAGVETSDEAALEDAGRSVDLRVASREGDARDSAPSQRRPLSDAQRRSRAARKRRRFASVSVYVEALAAPSSDCWAEVGRAAASGTSDPIGESSVSAARA